MSDQTTCADTRNAISSQVSVGGLWLYALPDGRMTDASGLVRALASLSARQVKALGLQISGTSGRRGSTSSASARLQRSLENKLRARLTGSLLCSVIWKAWITPWGQCLSKPRALVHSIDAIDSGLWPTPAARDWRSESATAEFYVRWAATPKGKTLPMMLALWATPTAVDHARGLTTRPQDTGKPLPQQLGEALGIPSAGSLGTTGKRGQLNPAFPRWLMGYPP